MNVDFKSIKEQVSMADLVISYGYIPNRAGFIACPFHKEKTASLKIYQSSFYCFGCGKGGDIFTFVENLLNVKPYEALKIIQHKFCITNYNSLSFREKQAIIRRQEAERDRKASEEWFNNTENILLDYYRLCWQGKQDIKNPNFTNACLWLEEAEYLLDFLNKEPKIFYKLNRIWIEKIKARVELLKIKEVKA